MGTAEAVDTEHIHIEGWHLVGDSDSECASERSGSPSPATPRSQQHSPRSPRQPQQQALADSGGGDESEELADCFLGLPLSRPRSAEALGSGIAAGAESAAASSSAPLGQQQQPQRHDDEVEGVICLSRMSQEGSLEGFAAGAEGEHSTSTSRGRSDSGYLLLHNGSSAVAPDWLAAAAMAAGSQGGVSYFMQQQDALEGRASAADAQPAAPAAEALPATPQQRQQPAAAAGGASLLLPSFLGSAARGFMSWLGGLWEELRNEWRDLHGMLAVHAVQVSGQVERLSAAAAAATAAAAASAAEVVSSQAKALGLNSATVRVRAAAEQAASWAGRHRVPLLTVALGASMCGLAAAVSQVRALSAALRQRDRELARLVVKILNLQDALQQGHPGTGHSTSAPILRALAMVHHTANMLS